MTEPLVVEVCVASRRELDEVAREAGERFEGRYRVEALIATGGMGKVYRATQLPLGRVVALKVLHERYQGDAALVAAFEQEARAASLIRHPNSVQVLDFGCGANGQCFIAMELMDGASVQDRLKRDGVPPLHWSVSVMVQVLAGLAAAHDAGVVHGDVKPENVLLTKSVGDDGSPVEVVKVCDFGIARVRAAGARHTPDEDRPLEQQPGSSFRVAVPNQQQGTEPRQRQSAVSEPALDLDGAAPIPGANLGAGVLGQRLVLGTPEYMSPEQVLGHEVDVRSDLYSCGVMLFQLLNGTLPFHGRSPQELARQQVEGPVPRLGRNSRLYGSQLQAVIDRALQKDPRARYQSAREMRRALMEAVKPSAQGVRRNHGRSDATRSRAPTYPRAWWGVLWVGVGLWLTSIAGAALHSAARNVAPASAAWSPSRVEKGWSREPLERTVAVDSGEMTGAKPWITREAQPEKWTLQDAMTTRHGNAESALRQEEERKKEDTKNQPASRAVRSTGRAAGARAKTPGKGERKRSNAATTKRKAQTATVAGDVEKDAPEPQVPHWFYSAHVAIDYVQVRGELPAAQVRTAARKRMKGLKACRDQDAQQRDSQQKDRVELSLEVDVSGSVRILGTSASHSRALAGCVAGELAKMAISEPAAPAQARIAIEFR